jgi:hypothetical protein
MRREASWDASCVEARQDYIAIEIFLPLSRFYAARFSAPRRLPVNCRPCVRPRARRSGVTPNFSDQYRTSYSSLRLMRLRSRGPCFARIVTHGKYPPFQHSKEVVSASAGCHVARHLKARVRKHVEPNPFPRNSHFPISLIVAFLWRLRQGPGVCHEPCRLAASLGNRLRVSRSLYR